MNVFIMLSGLMLAMPPAARAAVPAHALVGDWYNADYGIYPDFAVLHLSADGSAFIAGLDGQRRSGDYQLNADGRLVIRIADDARPALLRVIIESAPVLEGERLQLQGRRKTFFLSRARWLKLEVEKATARHQLAQAREPAPKPPPRKEIVPKPAPATPPASPALAEAGGDDEPVVPEPEPRVIRRVLSRLSGEGSGAEGCGQAVLDGLRESGRQWVERAADADVIVEIALSAIRDERSIWVGRYYKVDYHIALKEAADGRLLDTTEGSERASGDGRREVCDDVADDIAGEVEDLIEDAEDD